MTEQNLTKPPAPYFDIIDGGVILYSGQKKTAVRQVADLYNVTLKNAAFEKYLKISQIFEIWVDGRFSSDLKTISVVHTSDKKFLRYSHQDCTKLYDLSIGEFLSMLTPFEIAHHPTRFLNALAFVMEEIQDTVFLRVNHLKYSRFVRTQQMFSARQLRAAVQKHEIYLVNDIDESLNEISEIKKLEDLEFFAPRRTHVEYVRGPDFQSEIYYLGGQTLARKYVSNWQGSAEYEVKLL